MERCIFPIEAERKVSRTAKVTEKKRALVLEMIKANATVAQIAAAVGMSAPTLRKHFRDELRGEVRRPSYDPRTWTDQERAAVLSMASYGIPIDEIARCFATTGRTLATIFGDDLKNARTRLNASIARSLVRSALVGNNVAAQIFLAKTRLKWSERIEVAHEGQIAGGVADADIESALKSMSAKGRDALRTLIEEAPPASQTDGDEPERAPDRLVH